jgi:Ethanolamine utilization protein EutJ (predicted chaperonin)
MGYNFLCCQWRWIFSDFSRDFFKYKIENEIIMSKSRLLVGLDIGSANIRVVIAEEASEDALVARDWGG